MSEPIDTRLAQLHDNKALAKCVRDIIPLAKVAQWHHAADVLEVAAHRLEGEISEAEIRSAIKEFWIHDVNKPSWFSDAQNERLVHRICAALEAAKAVRQG